MIELKVEKKDTVDINVVRDGVADIPQSFYEAMRKLRIGL